MAIFVGNPTVVYIIKNNEYKDNTIVKILFFFSLINEIITKIIGSGNNDINDDISLGFPTSLYANITAGI